MIEDQDYRAMGDPPPPGIGWLYAQTGSEGDPPPHDKPDEEPPDEIPTDDGDPPPSQPPPADGDPPPH